MYLLIIKSCNFVSIKSVLFADEFVWLHDYVRKYLKWSRLIQNRLSVSDAVPIPRVGFQPLDERAYTSDLRGSFLLFGL